ncbi:hypothetical protein INR49_006182 [Caranx melampygus]|nr:hypothetical protein INR49_006182 [Caranx melampygus]
MSECHSTDTKTAVQHEESPEDCSHVEDDITQERAGGHCKRFDQCHTARNYCGDKYTSSCGGTQRDQFKSNQFSPTWSSMLFGDTMADVLSVEGCPDWFLRTSEPEVAWWWHDSTNSKNDSKAAGDMIHFILEPRPFWRLVAGCSGSCYSNKLLQFREGTVNRLYCRGHRGNTRCACEQGL